MDQHLKVALLCCVYQQLLHCTISFTELACKFCSGEVWASC